METGFCLKRGGSNAELKRSRGAGNTVSRRGPGGTAFHKNLTQKKGSCKMKTRKKFVSILCAAALLVSALPAAAAEKTETNNASTDFYMQVESFLQNADVEYGISKYDNVFLGGEIPAYYVEDETGALQTSSIHYYPIFGDDSVIGLLETYNDENGNQVFYYSKAHCKTINNFLKENVPIAVVGNGTSLFVVSNNKTENLTEAGNTANLPCEYSEVICSSPLNNLHSLNIAAHQQSRAADSYMISGVLRHTQHETWACWAACVASYGYFYTEKNYTYTSKVVADKMNWHDYATMSKVKSALKSLYGISHPYYSASNLHTSNLIRYISNDKPIMAGLVKSTNSSAPGHMVIIRGYASKSSFFGLSIMDPAESEYALVSVSTDNPITFPIGAQVYKLNEYLVNG